MAHLTLAYHFDGGVKRIEVWEYPLPALREAILNAMVHRDYSEPSDIQIKIYDDRITIYSPGKLYGDLTIEHLRKRSYQSSLRNKLVAEAFYLTKRIEKYGSGFIRIQLELDLYGTIGFSIDEIANGILVTFIKHHVDSRTVSTDSVKELHGGVSGGGYYAKGLRNDWRASS